MSTRTPSPRSFSRSTDSPIPVITTTNLSLTPPPSTTTSPPSSPTSTAPSTAFHLPLPSSTTGSPASPRSPRGKSPRRRKRSINDIMLNSSPAVSTSSVPVGQAAKKAILKGNLCVGSLDLPLPPTNDRILKKYTLSSEVGSIDIKTAVMTGGETKNICMEIGGIHFNNKVDKHTLLYVDVGGMEKTASKTAHTWEEELTKPQPQNNSSSTFSERIYTPPPSFDRSMEMKETGGVPIALQNVSPSTQVIRVKIMAYIDLGEDVLVGEAMVPLPVTADLRTHRDKTQKTTFVNYSFGRKIGELEVELHPTFLCLEKDVYFELMPGMPHGYLGFNRVEAESTKATQSAIKVLKFACDQGPAPIDGLHSCFSSEGAGEFNFLGEKYHEADHMGTIHLGKGGIKDLKPEKQKAFDLASHLRVIENTGFTHRVAIGDLVNLINPTKSATKYVDIMFGDSEIHHFPQKFLAPASIDETSLYDSIVLHVDEREIGGGRETEKAQNKVAQSKPKRSWPIIPAHMTAIVKIPGSIPDFPDMPGGEKKKGPPPTFHLKVCFLGSGSSGRREMFLACSLKRPINKSTYYDPKIVSIRGFEALSGLGFVKYDLLDCPLSVVTPGGGKEADKEREHVMNELCSADLICLCLSLIDAPSVAEIKALVPQLQPLGKPIILIGTQKDKRDTVETTSDTITVLGSDSLQSLMVPISRDTMISPKSGQELMDDIGASAYVEVSSKNFQGFRTLANAGLAVALGKNARTNSGPALSDKMRKKVETSAATPKDEKCKVM